MLTVAVRTPVALGSNVTVNVVVPPPLATGVVGPAVTVKSAAAVPEITTSGIPPVRFSAAVPVLVIVNVFGFVPPTTSTLPKSVSSAVAGTGIPIRNRRRTRAPRDVHLGRHHRRGLSKGIPRQSRGL